MEMRSTHIFWATLLACLSILMAGCKSHTVTGAAFYYPEGADYASAQYRVFVEMHGAKGQAYVAFSTKRVFVSVFSSEGEELLGQEYSFSGGNVSADVEWVSDRSFVLYLLECSGEGRCSYSSEGAKLVLKREFRFDKTHGYFAEVTA